MSAYVIVEFTVKDPDVVREKYSPNAAQTVKEHGGGFWGASTSPEAAYEAVRGTCDLADNSSVLLLTDGVTRLAVSRADRLLTHAARSAQAR
jgi:hypothetical protein